MGFKTWEEVLSVSPDNLASQPFVLDQVRFPISDQVIEPL